MKKISKLAFQEISDFMNKDARNLEKAIFNYYFNNGNEDNILNALKEYQSIDGGFGHGIEADFTLPNSSPLGTSIALRYLNILGDNINTEKMISDAIKYLEETFNEERNGWYSVPKEVNDYPHGEWWDYRDDINMTIIDYSWGNPTAEIIGYLYKYRKYVSTLDIDFLVDYAIDKFNEKNQFNSEHEIYCYIKMYNNIDKERAKKLRKSLEIAVSQLINIDENQWIHYVPTPLKFIEFDSIDFFNINSKYIDLNLEYLIDKLEENKQIKPTWDWDNYREYWIIAYKHWIGNLTLLAMLSLKKFDRI